MPASAQTLDRIKETAFIKLGYLDDARPFSFASSAGKPDGYTIELCQRIVEELKKELALPQSDLGVRAGGHRLAHVRASTARASTCCVRRRSVTLAKRKEASFSIPVFGGGIRAVMMTDCRGQAACRARSGHQGTDDDPVWRGSPASRVLKGMTFAVVTGTASEKWLEGRRQALGVDAKVEPVADYHTGMRLLQERKVDAFFGDGTLILAAIDPAARKSYTVLDRQFTHEPYALGLAHGDDDFRAAVDRALSHIYASPDFAEVVREVVRRIRRQDATCSSSGSRFRIDSKEQET